MADTSATDGPLRIAVVGAGLVGSAAVIALSKLPNTTVTAFERAPTPREAGAWISLNPTGLAILNELVDPAAIRRIAYRPEDNAVYVTRHWRTGQVLLRNYSSSSLAPDYVQARTHRWPLLQALLYHVPADAIRYNSEIIGLDLQSNGVKLRLRDDRVSGPFDLVVAADGIYSKIRKHFLPDHKVGYKGAVAYRKNFPVALIKNVPGLPNDSSAWRSSTDVVFLSRLGLDIYGIVIIRPESQEYAATLKWERSIGPGGLDRLRSLYKHWDPCIGHVLDLVEDLDAYPLDSGPWLQTLVRENRVAFVGDAAHPTAGAFGAGAGMGFGDCWALYRSLQMTRMQKGSHVVVRPEKRGQGGFDIERALSVFNETRRHFLLRVEKQMALDRAKNAYITAAGEDEEQWIARFVAQLPPSRWLQEHSVELEFQKTIDSEPLWSRL